MSGANRASRLATMSDRLYAALREAELGRGSHGPIYDGHRLAASIRDIIAGLDDAGVTSKRELSKFYAWLQSMQKAECLMEEAGHEMLEGLSTIKEIVTFFSVLSKGGIGGNICVDQRNRWLAGISIGARLCYTKGHRGDSSTLSEDIFEFIKDYRDPLSNSEVDPMVGPHDAYLSCLAKARELGYPTVSQALAQTPGRVA